MGATEEQIAILAAAHVTHVSYILLIFSAAFLLFLFVCVLLHIYAQATWPLDSADHKKQDIRSKRLNGGIALPDTPIAVKKQRQRPRDTDLDLERAKGVEEFELEGLMSEEEDGETSVDAGKGSSSSAVSSEDSGSGRRKELV